MVEELKILNLTKKSNKNGVKIDSEEALRSDWGLFSNQEVLVEFLFSGFFNTRLPLLDLLVLELSEILAQRCIKLLNILILFAVLNALRKLRKALHWLLNSLIETVGPVECTGNGRQVVGDGRSLINAVNQAPTLKEDLLNSLQVLLVKLQKSYVFLFKLILNDGTVEETLEGVQEFELSYNGIRVIEALC